ncbi:MAG TPA: hypothetical protein VGD08_15450 [Stellaceae bacterium]
MSTQSMGGQTGTSDPVYNLISVAYHTLQAAETHEQYAQDAQQQGDQELANFFRQAQQQCRQSAEQAKQLLASRLQGGGGVQAGMGAGQATGAMGHAGDKPGQGG